MEKDLTIFTRLLKQYIGFKSVPTDMAFASEIEAKVNWLAILFKEYGFTVSILKGTNTNPVVLAEYHVSDDLKTKLIYGHYYVQRAEIDNGRKTEPFELQERNGRLIGYGIVDNKGQNFIHILTAISLIKSGGLKCNLKFLIEDT